jgi:hypothetical protein
MSGKQTNNSPGLDPINAEVLSCPYFLCGGARGELFQVRTVNFGLRLVVEVNNVQPK